MFSILYLKKNSIKTLLSINSVFSDRKLGHEFVLSKNLIFNQKISPNTLNKKNHQAQIYHFKQEKG
jgi:hypothetical protein